MKDPRFSPCSPGRSTGGSVDRRFRYRQKNVQDIPTPHGVIRVWDAAGDFDRKSIEKTFEPLLRSGFVFPYVALMPDHHPGEGAMVGSVIPTKEVLLPSVIGGDLGCGVTAVRLPVQVKELEKNKTDIRIALQAVIPRGTAHNATVTERVEENPLWRRELRTELFSKRLLRKLIRQFASLGGGNHFLEIQQDTDGNAWLMLHSGSRYLGVIVRDHYIAAGRDLEAVDPRIYRRVPYLPAGTDLAAAYLVDLAFAVDFARQSRREMMLRAIEVLVANVPVLQDSGVDFIADGLFDVAHNYVVRESHFGEQLFVHRKGAVRAQSGETVMIPGSMGTASFIAEGRGNEHAFCSCSHGAGRVMSRGTAIRAISDKNFEAVMEGVDFDNDPRLKDESPLAYKDIRSVMRGQKDLVAIRTELHPVISIKGVN